MISISFTAELNKGALESAQVGPQEIFSVYYGRSHDYWMDEAEKELDEQNVGVTGGRLKNLARSLAKKFYDANTEDY